MQYLSNLLTKQTLTKHDVVGDLIYGTIFSYFALNNVQDEIAQQSANIVSYRAPSYGLFTTSLNTQYWFGVPRNVQFGGLSMDVDYASHQTVDKQNSQQGWINYNRAIGSRYSAMEHLVPEQMFSTDEAPAQGISAVKAIAQAAAEGQRIYAITQNNLYTAMAQLQLSTDTEQEIQNAVNAGFEVTTHQYQINFNGWVGEGYIIIDPSTGAGAYKIAGGGNGSSINSEEALPFIYAGLATGFEDVIIDFIKEFLLSVIDDSRLSILDLLVSIYENISSLYEECSIVHLLAFSVLNVLLMAVAFYVVASLLPFVWGLFISLILAFAMRELLVNELSLCRRFPI